METIFKTRFLLHIKSLRYVILGLVIISIVLYYILIVKQQKFFFNEFLVIGLPIFLLIFGPALYLHLSYYFENFGFVIKVDESLNNLTIFKKGNHYIYKLSDVISIERHLGIFYRNRIDRASRRVASWSPYGYIMIKLNDEKRFYITCLMMDMNNPHFKLTNTYFRFFPNLKSSRKFSEKRAIVNENFQNEISQYKNTLNSFTSQQLEDKINKNNKDSKASIEAAKQILSARKEKANN